MANQICNLLNKIRKQAVKIWCIKYAKLTLADLHLLRSTVLLYYLNRAILNLVAKEINSDHSLRLFLDLWLCFRHPTCPRTRFRIWNRWRWARRNKHLIGFLRYSIVFISSMLLNRVTECLPIDTLHFTACSRHNWLTGKHRVRLLLRRIDRVGSSQTTVLVVQNIARCHQECVIKVCTHLDLSWFVELVNQVGHTLRDRPSLTHARHSWYFVRFLIRGVLWDYSIFELHAKGCLGIWALHTVSDLIKIKLLLRIVDFRDTVSIHRVQLRNAWLDYRWIMRH